MPWTQTESLMILLSLPRGSCEQLVSAKIAQTRTTFKARQGSFKMNPFHFVCQAPRNVCSFDRITEVHIHKMRPVWDLYAAMKRLYGLRHHPLEKMNGFQNHQERSHFPTFIINEEHSNNPKYKTHSHSKY